MRNLEDIRQLTIHYLNGSVTRDDERRLLSFIGESQTNKELFRQWEEEWAAHHLGDGLSKAAFGKFEARLLLQSEAKNTKTKLWRTVAAAAAVVALMVGSAYATWLAADARPEKFYSFSAPYGSKARVALPDSSVVWLNAGSSLRYSNRFNEHNRRVELQGEGYFQVSKDARHEFVVKTDVGEVTVKGTRFDVSAYREDRVATVSLMQGRVEFNGKNETVAMRPGERVTVDRLTGELKKTTFVNDSRAWIDNNTDFDAITLGELAKVLSRQYNVNIHVGSSKLAMTRFSISLHNKETIGDVIDALQRISQMTVQRRGKDIYLSD